MYTIDKVYTFAIMGYGGDGKSDEGEEENLPVLYYRCGSGVSGPVNHPFLFRIRKQQCSDTDIWGCLLVFLSDIDDSGVWRPDPGDPAGTCSRVRIPAAVRRNYGQCLGLSYPL